LKIKQNLEGKILFFNWTNLVFLKENNKGRATNQIWIFGFMERDTGQFFAQVIEKRNTATLIPIIVG